MRIVGLDISGIDKNPTGYCTLNEVDGTKKISVKLLYTDEEIIENLKSDSPELIAIDAPLIYNGVKRSCDEQLREYDVLPVTLPGMTHLAKRGSDLARKLTGYDLSAIEVNVRAAGKILGVQNKDDFTYQKNVMSLDFDGDLTTRLLSKDELDSIVCALTGYLYNIGQTKEVGDETGRIIIPKI